MEVLGRDIGTKLDRMYHELLSRVRTEAERELRVEWFDGALSNVRWTDDEVVIYLNEQVPTHALPHVLGVALQHVRQRLDRFPDVRRPEGEQPEGSPLVRTALREVVLAPDAEAKLGGLALDQQWETEQRHLGMKQMLDDPPEEWEDPTTLGAKFIALQYAKMELLHPAQMWSGLRKTMEKKLPAAASLGDDVVHEVRRYRWGSAQACFRSLVNARDALGLEEIAVIEDRRTGRFY